MLNQEVREYATLLGRQTQEIQARISIPLLLSELGALSAAGKTTSIPASVTRSISFACDTFGAQNAGAFAKLIVLALIDAYPQRARGIVLPESIKSEYPKTFKRILTGILSGSHESYFAESGDFWRDLCLAAQFWVPLTTSRIMDRCAFLPRTFFRYMGYALNLRSLGFVVFRLHGLGPIFRVHIDERDTSDFNESGWELSYFRVAEMMRLYPTIKGVAGSSWTLDPQLDRISPKIAYPRRCLVENGAYLHFDGPGEKHTQLALKKSATRRRYYEAGEYLPTAYTIVWPRRDILRWATKVS
jgi:hypothetical protein